MNLKTCEICGKDYPASNWYCHECNDESAPRKNHTPTSINIRYEDGGTMIINNFAKKVVKCVNSHDFLVETLKECQDYIYGLPGYMHNKEMQRLTTTIEQALKKAEE